MERLTFDGSFCDIAQCRELPCPYDGSCTQREVWKRLKEYEDTGLTPGEIVKMGMAYEDSKRYSGRLEGRLKAYEDTGLRPEVCANYKAFEDEAIGKGVTFARIVELMEADKAGRTVVLPCKAGDTVYTIFGEEIIEKRIGHFHINSYTTPMLWADLDCDFMSKQRVRWDLSVGKDFFLTREEAEKALEVTRDA